MSNLLSLYNENPFWSRYYINQSLKVIPYQKIDSYVPNKGKILDFGCGHGIFANLMSLSSNNRLVVGCDIDEHKIDIALNTIQDRKNICFINDNIMDIDEKFDGITIISVLYLIPYEKQEEILRHLVDLLAEDGKLIIVEFDKEPKWKYYWGFLREYLMTSFYTKSEGLFYR